MFSIVFLLSFEDFFSFERTGENSSIASDSKARYFNMFARKASLMFLEGLSHLTSRISCLDKPQKLRLEAFLKLIAFQSRQIRSKVTYRFCVSSHKNCIKQIAEKRGREDKIIRNTYFAVSENGKEQRQTFHYKLLTVVVRADL